MTMGIQKDLEERNLLRNSIRDLIQSKKKEKGRNDHWWIHEYPSQRKRIWRRVVKLAPFMRKFDNDIVGKKKK